VNKPELLSSPNPSHAVTICKYGAASPGLYGRGVQVGGRVYVQLGPATYDRWKAGDPWALDVVEACATHPGADNECRPQPRNADEARAMMLDGPAMPEAAERALAPFAFEGHDVRVVMQDGEPWFVGKDVCAALGLKNHKQVLSRLDDDEKGVQIVDPLRDKETSGKRSSGGTQRAVTINEPGLYRLIFTSRVKAAQRFKRWLAHEVLPVLRRTGSYSMPNARPASPPPPPARPRTGEDVSADSGDVGLQQVLAAVTEMGRAVVEATASMAQQVVEAQAQAAAGQRQLVELLTQRLGGGAQQPYQLMAPPQPAAAPPSGPDADVARTLARELEEARATIAALEKKREAARARDRDRKRRQRAARKARAATPAQAGQRCQAA